MLDDILDDDVDEDDAKPVRGRKKSKAKAKGGPAEKQKFKRNIVIPSDAKE